MPKTQHPGVALWKRIAEYYGDARGEIDVAKVAADLRMNVRAVSQMKVRGRVSVGQLDHVTKFFGARPVQNKKAPKEVPMPTPDTARRYQELVHLLVRHPVWKEMLLGYGWAQEDRDVVTHAVERAEKETE